MSSWLQKGVKVAPRRTDLDATFSNRLISAAPLSQRETLELDDITDHIQYGGIRLRPPGEDGGRTQACLLLAFIRALMALALISSSSSSSCWTEGGQAAAAWAGAGLEEGEQASAT